MRYDVAIIGAGLSGLAAAIRLAHYGRKVAVFERHYRVGGLNSWYKRGPMVFDTGLHAMTNFAPRTERKAPLNRMLRQLRIPYDVLRVSPQTESSISFPDLDLSFSNSPEQFFTGIQAAFPNEFPGFLELVDRVKAYDAFSYDLQFLSSRKVLEETVGNGLLQEMLLCPIMYYGSAWEHDLDFRQFAILFRSIFLEGLFRPGGGATALLGVLRNRLETAGAELHLGTGVAEIVLDHGRVAGLILDDGREVMTHSVVSCAGHPETLAICGGLNDATNEGPKRGMMSFVESIFVIDVSPSELGFKHSISFINRHNSFAFEDPGCLLDDRSAVLCVPANFQFDEVQADARVVRLTNIASYDKWRGLSVQQYQKAKDGVRRRQIAFLDSMARGFGRHVDTYDTFTPLTIEKYTGHRGGAVYGSPDKLANGMTGIPGLFLCGTDQGFLGIVGALLSGVSVANLHLLR